MLGAKDGQLLADLRLSNQSSFLTTIWVDTGGYMASFTIGSSKGVLQLMNGVVVVTDDILVYGRGDSQEEVWWGEYNLKHNKVKS